MTAPTSLDPWQALLTTRTTVPAVKVSEAADVLRGFQGSWAGYWSLDPGVLMDTGTPDPTYPGAHRVKYSHLGVPGFPEINFAPYSFRTNRGGLRGGSFLGHPISFSIVGPTAKNSSSLWSWRVSTSGSNDRLLLQFPGGFINNIYILYGFSSLSDYPGGLYLTISQSGEDGELTAVLNPGGIGDGVFSSADASSIAPHHDPGDFPLIGKLPSSKYEIFRVVAITTTTNANDTLELDSGKRILTYFSTPHGAKTPGGSELCRPYMIRAITLMTPAATRLVAVPGPGSTPGHETAFAVVPPERALNQDEQYPYIQWAGGGFGPANWKENNYGLYLGPGASIFEYNHPPLLPVPKPRGNFTANLPAGAVSPPGTPAPAGLWGLTNVVVPDGLPSQLVGSVVHLWQATATEGEVSLYSDGVYTPPISTVLGWFEVMSGTPSSGSPGTPGTLQLRRMMDVDPETGRFFLGSGSYFYTPDDDPTSVIVLNGTFHDPIFSLWAAPQFTTAPYMTYTPFDMDAVNSARLTNLIDPSWVERSNKDQPAYRDDSPSRSDRAIFQTASSGAGASGTNTNPGNMLDLGFRMVLFPAKTATVLVPDYLSGVVAATSTRCVPDFDHPVDANEVILDPSQYLGLTPATATKQTVTIDYSNGMVYLSIPPQPDPNANGAWSPQSPLYPSEAVLTSPDNPRGEVVIFAACVPYSQEPGQLGAALRVTADTSPLGVDQTDVWGNRITAQVNGSTTADATTQVIISQHLGPLVGDYTPPGPYVLKLDGDLRQLIPDTGFVELFLQDIYGNITGPMFGGTKADGYVGSLFGYYGVYSDGTYTTLGLQPNATTYTGVWGGGAEGSIFTVEPSINAVTTGTIIIGGGTTAGDTVTVGYITFTSTTGAPVGPQFYDVTTSGKTTVQSATSLVAAINAVYAGAATNVGGTSATVTVTMGTNGVALLTNNSTDITLSSSALQGGTGPAIAVFRRDVWGPNTPDGIAAVAYPHDVTYGAAKRNNAVRFNRATLQPNADGSITVNPVPRVHAVSASQSFVQYIGPTLGYPSNLTVTVDLENTNPVLISCYPALGTTDAGWLLSGSGAMSTALLLKVTTIFSATPIVSFGVPIQTGAAPAGWPPNALSVRWTPPAPGTYTFTVSVDVPSGSTLDVADVYLAVDEL